LKSGDIYPYFFSFSKKSESEGNPIYLGTFIKELFGYFFISFSAITPTFLSFGVNDIIEGNVLSDVSVCNV
jgi:hypothetical protein